MRKIADMIEKEFGRLKIKEFAYTRNKRSYWSCKCQCGNTIIVRQDKLKSLNVQSCGCLQKEQRILNGKKNALINFKQYNIPKKPPKIKGKRGRPVISLIGQTFNDFKVIDKAEDYISPNGHKLTQWKCQCKCGTIRILSTSTLKSGDVYNCGCETLLHNSKGENKIRQLLTDNNIIFEREKTFDDLKLPSGGKLRFDFYVNNHYVIEYDGEQHYKSNKSGWSTKENLIKTQENDKIKNQYCFDNNIPIIRIPYWHFDNLCIEDLMLDTTEYEIANLNLVFEK